MMRAPRWFLIAATGAATLWGTFVLLGIGVLTKQWQADGLRFCKYFTATGMDTRVSGDVWSTCTQLWF